ncbi:hypothetical protein XENTR_v10023951 [Xenopus tropicalis]|nr:hypothetical protein XENTR_v10023951 [Xenopus tropicalis]
MVKNKEQVRHFYYRTWHKISKYIDFNNVFSRGLKKSSQELYGLICYGELRKKIGGCMDDKNATKLNELIQLGVTTVRYKGRNLRIKAPMCRALKKLCDPDGKTGLSDEEDQKPVRLPLKVPVELQPRNNQAWARVQSLAQNPRLRMIVELHRKVSSLIEFLKQKWALKEVRIRKTLEDHQLKELGPQESEDELFLFPTEAAQLSSLPGVARVVHSKAYCTVHWQETGKCKQSIKDTHLLPPAQILGIQTGQGTARVQLKCLKGGADGNKGSKVNGGTDALPYRTQVAEDGFVENAVSTGVSLSPKTPDESPPEHVDSPADAPYEGSGSRQPDVEELSLLDPFPRYLKSCQDLIIPEENDCTDKALDISPTSPETLHSGTMEVSPGQRDTEPQTTAGGPADTCTTETSGTESQEKEQCDPSKPSQDSANQFIEQLRQVGWNQRTSENLTLAEVYLMLGKPGKLQLEYEWLAPSSSDGSGHTTCHKQRLLNCLLRLISTEVNHKTSLQAPETTSVATSPMKLPVQDQTLTPPGKVITLLSRNPSCLQSQLTPQIHSHFPSTSSTPGFRNLPRPLLVGNPLGSVTSTTDGGVFAVPTMRPPNSRHSKVSSPGKESGSPVRQPLDAISSEFFLPKSKKPRSRHPRKPLVVQRTLLPRPSGSSSHNVCSFSILSNSSVAGRGSFRPIHTSLGSTSVSHIVPKGLPTTNPLSSAIDLAAKTAGIIPGGTVPVVDTEGLSGITPLPPDGLTGTSQTAASQSTSTDSIPSVTVSAEDPIPFMALSTTPVQESRQSFQPSAALSLPELSQNSLQNGPSNASTCTPSSAGSCLSPPNVSALLDISLPGPPDDVLSHGGTSTHISDSIIEIAISSGQFGEAVPLSPAKLNDSSKSLPSPNSSPQQNWIASPSHDPQWYPNDSTDSSLSSLFSSFISPEKGRKTLPTAPGSTSGTSLLGPSLLDGSSRDSFVSRTLDVTEVVDSQLACLMNENSIDYISRFNDLAQELSATEPTRREVPFESGAPASGQPIRDLS